MSRGLNRVELIGHLGANPETKFLPSGAQVANFNLATTEGRKNAGGDWEDHTEWHRIVMFGRSAEVCKDYLHKGSKIFLEGKLQTRSWDDKDGKKRYTTEIVGRQMIMLDGRSDQSNSPDNNAPPGDDDLPF